MEEAFDRYAIVSLSLSLEGRNPILVEHRDPEGYASGKHACRSFDRMYKRNRSR